MVSGGRAAGVLHHSEQYGGRALRRAGADIDSLEAHRALRVKREAVALHELHMVVTKVVELLARVLDELRPELDAELHRAPSEDRGGERREVCHPEEMAGTDRRRAVSSQKQEQGTARTTPKKAVNNGTLGAAHIQCPSQC